MKQGIWFAITAAIAAVFLAADWYAQRHILLDGRWYPRNAAVLSLPAGVPEDSAALSRFPYLRWLDLRGTGLSRAQIQALAGQLPLCRICWELAFQGGQLPAEAREITLQHLSDSDVVLLDALDQLQAVDATRCHDYPQLLALAQRRPNCEIRWLVELGGQQWRCSDTLLCPGPCTREQTAKALPLLPKLRRVDLRGTGLSHEDCVRLAQQFPHVRFLWNAEICGATVPTDAHIVDLSGIPMEGTEAVEALIPWLPEAEKIILCDCGIPSPEMAAMQERWPDIRFVWRVKLGPLSARTDDKWFAPITHHQLIGGHDVDELKYCIDMECIDLGHCWIRDCEWARNMKNLKYLVLADSQVTDLSPLSELKHLQYLELFVTPVKDYSPLLGCTALEDLNLGYTSGSPAPIAKMTWLKNLWWGGIRHVPGAEGLTAEALLRRNLPNTRLTLYSGSSTGLGWRNLKHYYEMRDRIGMYYMVG